MSRVCKRTARREKLQYVSQPSIFSDPKIVQKCIKVLRCYTHASSLKCIENVKRLMELLERG